MLQQGDTIYKQFQEKSYKNVSQMIRPTWFALEANYGNSYGSKQCSYRVKIAPYLLDLGNANVRDMIKNYVAQFDKRIVKYSDPDYQYSGLRENLKYHMLIKQYYDDKYDGTIIDQNKLHYNENYSKKLDELAGPSEIVIWKNFNNILEEIL